MPSHVASKTYGTVSPDRRREMSGLEFVAHILAKLVNGRRVADRLQSIRVRQ